MYYEKSKESTKVVRRTEVMCDFRHKGFSDLSSK